MMASPHPQRSGNAFWEQGYVVAHDMLDAGQLAFARHAMDAALRAGRMQSGKRGITPTGALNEYSPIGAEALLLQCKPQVEAITGSALLPAYALWRIYENGASLLRHVDRNSCEISVSLPIVADPVDPPWPIHVADLQGEERAVALIPGAGIVYQGCRIPHWREPFPGRRQYQVFLHYVIKDGERADYAFDGRDGLDIAPGNPDTVTPRV